VLPFRLHRGPSDRLTQACAGLLLAPSPTRERLTAGIFPGIDNNGLARLERAFALTVAAAPLHERMRAAKVRDIDAARRQNVINDAEAAALHAAALAVAEAVAVDDFAPQEIARRQPQGDTPSQSMSQRTAAE